jgi:hypothetical protein
MTRGSNDNNRISNDATDNGGMNAKEPKMTSSYLILGPWTLDALNRSDETIEILKAFLHATMA